jgi:serine/threonine protein kinase
MDSFGGSRLMKVYKNGQDINLTNNDFVAAGGEGSIYRKGGEIFKVYTDPIQFDLIKKIEELSALDRDNIIRPLSPLHGGSGGNSVVGFTMKFVDNTIALPLLFTTSYRDRNGITPDKTITLVEKIAEVMQYIHEKKVLIVDANEFNYLIAKSDMVTPYFIDVDSYQTASFPAKVILPSIRDFANKTFTELTDWYSFGVVALQLFVGIHPYKGGHDDFKKDDIESRCKKHISVFNKEVRLPPPVRSFDLIPSNYKQWFIEVFENGKRILPPTVSGTIAVKAQQTIVSNKLIVNLAIEFPEKIMKTYWVSGIRVVQTVSFAKVGNRDYALDRSERDVHFIHFSSTFHKVFTRRGKLFIDDIEQTINADKVFVIDNRLYVLDGEFFREIELMSLMNKIMVSIKSSWNILPQSAVAYKNCIYNGVFKKNYFYIPFDSGKCQIVDIKMDGVRVIDAAYDKNTLYVMLFDKGIYSRALFKFNKEMAIVESAVENDVTLSEINMTSLNNGINLLLADGDIHITVPMRTEKKIVSSVGLPEGAVLTNDGATAHYFYENKLFSIKMS